MTVEEARGRKSDHVRVQLEDLIAQMHPGEPLPAERELAARIGVARMTLRRAVDALVAEHRLLRRPGAGTFVAPPRVDQQLSATSFSTDMRSRGMVPGAHTALARLRPAGMMLASVLQIRPNAMTLHVRRVRTADGEPMALEDLHVPADLVPGLTGDDLEDSSFYTLLESRYGLLIASGTQSVEPHLVTVEEAELLHTQPGSAAFLFERTSRVQDGRVVEFVRSVYRGDRYRIVVDLNPRNPQTTG
ncbi:GntR family transcriptional regulator [Ornithinimicrobium pekingense]|uniref:Transcriptional regulator n=1 Tax=Ornithinimicrobium pekingense TaxID=384677 RepID=A0ABQ2F7G3_9MICO|nr:GntR family transcriptional regulator [Ornithinimicrobium pekingense]GGK60465.1 transcriptional regulator [Ornithinimicrobium pekingense]